MPSKHPKKPDPEKDKKPLPSDGERESAPAKKGKKGAGKDGDE